MEEVISSYSTRDSRELFYRNWPCTKGGSGHCLIFIHGIESHSGWLSEVGEKLARLGLEVYALDRRGSGLNKEGRGDLADYYQLIQDIDDFILKKGLKAKKCILAGFCWGAKTALYFFLKNPEKISGIIFITPGFKTKLHVPFLKKIKWILASIFTPHLHLSLPIESEMFTRDEMYLNRIRGDELRIKTITPRFFKENLRLEKAIRDIEIESDTPAILFLAGEDEIVDNDGVIDFLKRYFRNLEIISYPGCRHGLFFEPKREALIQGLADWCFKH